MFEEKPKRRWQNLLHKKCPNCDSRLEDARLFWMCPNPHPKDEGRNCFFIKKEKAAAFLLDPNHPANFCLSEHERETIDGVIAEMGIVKQERSE
jgi:hypothetical protein